MWKLTIMVFSFVHATPTPAATPSIEPDGQQFDSSILSTKTKKKIHI
jgi:hypothetical protein